MPPTDLQLPFSLDMRRKTDLPGAEARLGYTFSDPSLGHIALHPSKRGFSRLEFLGDAILSVVVFTLAEYEHHPRRGAKMLVSNQRLREIYMNSFATYSPGNTGDVMEALVGAVYLDGGFLNAAGIITRAFETGFSTFDHDLIATKARSFDPRGLMWIGAHVESAVVAEHLCTTAPGETHKFFSQQRSDILLTSRLAERSRQLGLVEQYGEPKASTKKDANDADMLDWHVGTLFLESGWDLAKPQILEILDIAELSV